MKKEGLIAIVIIGFCFFYFYFAFKLVQYERRLGVQKEKITYIYDSIAKAQIIQSKYIDSLNYLVNKKGADSKKKKTKQIIIEVQNDSDKKHSNIDSVSGYADSILSAGIREYSKNRAKYSVDRFGKYKK